MIKLSELPKYIEVIKYLNEKEIDIEGISYDSRRVKEGDLFVCIKGYKTDGHRYIPQAIENGAKAIIVEDIQDIFEIPQIQVKDSRKALSALSAIFYDYPSKDMKVIGITGTNGKTSTSFLANSILENHRLKTGLIGTIMVKYGDYLNPSILTTPESLDLQKYFYQMKKENVSHAIMEVSSSALELSRVADVDYDIVAFNNISREHIDVHGSFDEYFKVKSSLIKNVKENGWAVLNLDCPYSSSLINKTKGNVLTYGIKDKNGDLSIRDLDLSTGRGKFTVELSKSLIVGKTEYKPQNFRIELGVPGYHSIYNSLVAISIGLLCEVPISTIQEALSSFTGVERRFQFIYDEDFKIVDDHFANVGNIDVTMETLSLMDYSNIHLVYAIRGNRGVITNSENAETIAKWAKKLGIKGIIATKSISHVMEKDRVSNDEVRVFKEIMDREGITVYLYNELPHAIDHALTNVSSGDIILLAGCQGMDYGAQIALEALYKLRPDLNKEKLLGPLKNRIAGIA
ncbi:UDP-N-acetylmuramoyl-L-alanyl-D-glutamate--2,6-diaminopimelate ligase [Anaerosalibacter bizertensis]|uniref:UDP-N-acetylmuramoyl-L-alanyl-D-glutamate--2, 6-diaminopimelate ligase n=1 Tax=Anaerosalibacter bizertensis TaxID=932217 RepID=A0A9Q4ABP5_9FIRM|nr:UDP-N-acetylmuramoyl-L-alanyl-D-glutamate--2,6-diaminopimelate ligase [Anaerosalibacter bizertensis]MBV1819124.1 UDP-N-acetylmuramoyl-L-alanyl-D-glutamate--2,6-diaminopimelate ligase [Bacteroidales bacterium MSK.15.36]MCB5559743.1 UDP-N-acetylmuramoyl-L-alanyl-D-glutamate--2,6-diaminopimelate ligase [Anaerosalibacter bizertensis]MCG4564706.1 UDP-N-acetylmuramoyl-L-alanyl-D-glutamate--2,6-diaminopimelate ligase [Anaerosalibacter bizertensis]MCG4582594.1 UDP-N-acetylmuramoyl-L-alanyl-D-glutama